VTVWATRNNNTAAPFRLHHMVDIRHGYSTFTVANGTGWKIPSFTTVNGTVVLANGTISLANGTLVSANSTASPNNSTFTKRANCPSGYSDKQTEGDATVCLEEGSEASGGPDQAYYGFDLYGSKDAIDEFEDDFGMVYDGSNAAIESSLGLGQDIANDGAFETCICQETSNSQWVSTGRFIKYPRGLKNLTTRQGLSSFHGIMSITDTQSAGMLTVITLERKISCEPW
jgi:hypothetical protein